MANKWTETEHLIAVSRLADNRAVFTRNFGVEHEASGDDHPLYREYWCLIEQCLAYDLGLTWWDAKPCESLGAFQGRVALLLDLAYKVTLNKLGVPYAERIALVEDDGEYWYAIEAALARSWGLK